MKQISRIVAYVAVLAVFNVIFFLLGGTDHSCATWISYGFIMFAILASYVTPLFCKNFKRIPENLVTIYVSSWIYLAIALIMNGLFIITKFDNYKIDIVFNAVVFVLYLIIFTVNLNVNTKVEKNLEHSDAERQFVRDASQKIRYCLDLTPEANACKLIERAYDEVRTSPIRSNEQVMNYELEVIRLVEELVAKSEASDWSSAGDIATQITRLVQKRNNTLLNS